MKRFGKWLSYFILALAIVFFTSALLVETVFSGELAIVRSSSMEPAMPAGALALMMPVDPETVKVGDIITFNPHWDTDVTVSHRVIGIKTNGQLYFDTKGDAVEESDPFYVHATLVKGKVIFNIPRLGYIANSAAPYVRTPWGFTFLVGFPAMLLFSITIRDTSRLTNRRQKRMQAWLKRRQQRRRR